MQNGSLCGANDRFAPLPFYLGEFYEVFKQFEKESYFPQAVCL